MISGMNLKYSERPHVTNHNSKWRCYTYTALLQVGITEEIIRSDVIGQATNHFICVAEDFVPYQRLEYRYVKIPAQVDVTEEIIRSKVIGTPINPFVDIAEDFVLFIRRYSDYFTVNTRSVAATAEQYLCGLMQSDKRNMERMAEVVPDSDEQSFQNFISNSPWNACAIVNQIGIDVDSLFGGDHDVCLIIDETSFIKKGVMSVGVARQWCGRLGKVENCQVGVFAALTCRRHVTLIDTRLYLPETWINNPERCRKAGIPEEFIVYQNKSEKALDMIKQARNNGIRFNWVGVDGGYGKEPDFLRCLDSTNEIFMADVHKDQRIYLEDPEPTVPEPKSNRGRKPTKLKAQTDPIRVDEWALPQPEYAWQMIPIRETTQGTLYAYILQERVWVWDGEEEEAHCWHLIIRLEIDSPKEIKYSLSNASKDSSVERLAFMQGQRFWVERALQDGKSECGLGCLPDSRLEWLASPYDTCNDGDVVHAGTSFIKQR
ncbi:MAG: transposase [Candidatus Methanogaster sp.]|uniref:Transposase n=1 Tax=Candidatus Methanogaster sp. TaxID=3386292 RepID=A0AC61L003_9EURY|nr:MAG: transposase [ANME-2 cluster archaeon]